MYPTEVEADDNAPSNPFLQRRAQCVQALQARLKSCSFNDFLKENVSLLNSYGERNDEKETQVKTTSSRVRRDSQTSWTNKEPLEPRSSARLANRTPPSYMYVDGEDFDDASNKRKRYEADCEVDTKRTRTHAYRAFPAQSKDACDVTDDEIRNVAITSKKKTYSRDGTSCHQCRQKTTDTKTMCRGTRCIGVRGQFCGPCLQNRYGECATAALKNQEWVCPPCRGLCNCSICRTRQGKRPTGILTPVAVAHGYSNVKDYLISLRGYGDYSDDGDVENDDGLSIGSRTRGRLSNKRASVDAVVTDVPFSFFNDKEKEEFQQMKDVKGFLGNWLIDVE